jgi:RNA polymerase sigma-70 factor (ECF subfamily)
VLVEGDLAQAVVDAQRGDAQAFGPLVEAHWAGLVRLARSIVGEAEAEDAVQEGLLAAWRKLAQLDDPARFRSWLTRIVFRRCLRRTLWNRLRRALDVLPERRIESDPEGELTAWALLARLAPRQRAVLHLTVVEGLSDSEIATELGIAAGSVRAHRRRARESLARIAKEEGRS